MKQAWGTQMHLRKAAAGSTPDAPFPVRIKFTPEPPDSCSLFDQLEELTIGVSINKKILSPGILHDLWQALEIAVESPHLPSELTAAMASELQQKVPRSGFTRSVFIRSGFMVSPVGAVLGAVREAFVKLPEQLPDLLTLKPRLLESYESVGATGNSERRIKFISAPQEEPSGGQRGEHVPAEGLAGEQSREEQKEAAQTPPAGEPGVPEAYSQVFKMLAARFPDLKATACVPDSGALPLSLPQQALPTFPPVKLSVSIVPSDAHWDHGPLLCHGVLAITGPAGCQARPDEARSELHRHADQATQPVRRGATPSSRGAARPVRAPHVPQSRAAGPPMAAALALEPGPFADPPTCAIVNHKLSQEAQATAGAHACPAVNRGLS